MGMVTLSDELRDRVLRLGAELHLGLVAPGPAVWLACDLLVAGVETPTVIELAGESPTGLRAADAVPLVGRALAELGVDPVEPALAGWVLARAVARQMIDGAVPAEDGARTIWGLWSACDDAEEIFALVLPLEVRDYERHGRDDERLDATLRELAGGVLRVATERLAAGGLIEA